jgi:uncharacterized tellurite resistance protein B-like protein
MQRHRDLMGQALGVFDHQLLSVLQFAGFTADTIALVEFVPLVHIAWADGAVSNRQRDLISRIATQELIGEETPAHDRLIGWLERCPSESVFEVALFAIHAKLDPLAPEIRAVLQRKLVHNCTAVALVADSALSDRKISADEARVLARILDSLKPVRLAR